MLMLLCLAYWFYSAPTRAVEDANVASIPELVVDTRVDDLQDELDSAKKQNRYLKAITPLVIIKPVDDVAKIAMMQEQIDSLNKLTIDKAVYENINNNYQSEDYPIYVVAPKVPTVNILHEIMRTNGSYSEAYKRAQEEGR